MSVRLGIIAARPLFGSIVDATGSYHYAWAFLALLGVVAFVSVLFVREAGKTSKAVVA